MCPANGELENGHPESPVDFLCRNAHLRAHAFGFPLAPHGDCEYCPGGSGYDELVRSGDALRRGVWPGPAERPASRLLPMLNTDVRTEVKVGPLRSKPTTNACPTGGCGSCNGHTH